MLSRVQHKNLVKVVNGVCCVDFFFGQFETFGLNLVR